MPPTENYDVRAFCNNDACTFTDMRVELGPSTPMPKCPECGSQLSTSRNVRPQRDTRTY